MGFSTNIHWVTEVRAGSVSYNNANAITLSFNTEDSGQFDLTLFNLPTHEADYLSLMLQPERARRSEEAIRADERRKLAERIGVSA